MTEQTGPAWAAGRASPAAGRRRVVGKAQLAVSTAGMLIVLGSLYQGRLLAAGAGFLLTAGILEIMFQRALGLFHAAPAAPRPSIRRETPRTAAAGE